MVVKLKCSAVINDPVFPSVPKRMLQFISFFETEFCSTRYIIIPKIFQNMRLINDLSTFRFYYMAKIFLTRAEQCIYYANTRTKSGA